jgi:hypothetical protein
MYTDFAKNKKRAKGMIRQNTETISLIKGRSRSSFIIRNAYFSNSVGIPIGLYPRSETVISIIRITSLMDYA